MEYIISEQQLKKLSNIIIETREAFMNFVRQKAKEVSGIDWPEYVLKDWLYRNTKNPAGEKPEQFKNLVKNYVESFIHGHGKGHWEFKVLDLSIESFTDFVKDDLIKKIEGGRREDIHKDKERHIHQQSQIEKVGISPEPIILVQTKNGKYDLLEGWHRTTAALRKYDTYQQNAWVYVLD